ncbi:MAG: DNA mismatch repair protein MutS [Elusimicrobiota bacterium]|jgi:DNA mismatch repair protein MutS|nr:DNA mismatch repair protein MutS [Elusimicrobiota bacterium]
MKQYWQIKNKYPEMVLMFRLGDFYEMFAEDAVKIHSILDLTLTHRNDLPMCGIPYRNLDVYLKKLINKGLRVAICDQLEEAQNAKGIVRRGVTRVVTPGTIIEDDLLESKVNNFLMSMFFDRDKVFYALADISTGDFFAGQTDFSQIMAEIEKYLPGEILISEADFSKIKLDFLTDNFKVALTKVPCESFNAEILNEVFSQDKILSFNLDKNELFKACAALISYIKQTQEASLKIFEKIEKITQEDFMGLDISAIKNLELLKNSTGGKISNSLLGVLDNTQTPMGARTLKQWLVKPLLNKNKIENRQNAVEFFVSNSRLRNETADKLKGVCDIERIAARIISLRANPRDLINLKDSLLIANEICKSLQEGMRFNFTDNLEVIDLIQKNISPQAPLNLKDGNVIKEGVDANLDELRKLTRDTKVILASIEQRERAATQIPNLKIGYNSVFGYYIELTKSYMGHAPKHYIRKQTLANAERYITQELKDLEDKILSAQEKLSRLESLLFSDLRQKLAKYAHSLLSASGVIAEIDVFCCFAKNAVDRNYCKPEINEGLELSIEGGRHPVVETILKDGSFCANDILFNDKERILILTGPNMGGKSTYLRQTALIVIMAQMGSWVPAKSASIGIVDKVFTRIGAGDNLAQGQSTFMLEMAEAANILRQYTKKSLIILDEIGRGTSTYDGISIATSILEFFADTAKPQNKGAKIIFATHYFELTVLQERFPEIVNLNVAVKEWNGEVIFLHRIDRGAADRSYGIYVAKLAGLPYEVIERAYKILAELVEQNANFESAQSRSNYTDLFSQKASQPQILIELSKVDLDKITPVDALNLLCEWKKKFS